LRLAQIVDAEIALKSFTYLFEELPLVMTGGYSACDVTGFAEIAYDTAGAWSVQRIGFDGFRARAPAASATGQDRPPPRFERAPVWLDSGDPIGLIVYDRLEHEWSARVQQQVDDRMYDDRIDAAERTVDHTIAFRWELT
jgi:hypothetical protein